MITRRLDRLAHRALTGDLAQVGRAYLSIDEAGRGALRQNAMRKEFHLPAMTHDAVYEQSEIVELPKPPDPY